MSQVFYGTLALGPGDVDKGGMTTTPLDRSVPRAGLDDPAERRAAGRMIGLLWIISGISGASWYLVPGAELEHLRLGLVCCSFSTSVGLASVLAPWRRMDPAWIYAAAGLSLVVIPIVIAVNGGADSPTVLYLFLASVIFGYYLPTRAAVAFLAIGVLIPATPMLYDAQALEPAFIGRIALTAPIYATVGLAVVLAKRQLVGWRNQAQRQALLDPLTVLANRRALTAALRDAAASPRTPWPLALVMIDLDDFKMVNTVLGHVGGDRALCSVAEILRRTTREDDLVARLGGDEFAILVAGASEADLADLSQRIVEEIRGTDLALAPPGCRLTASVGFTMVATGNLDMDEFLDRADRELREAKTSGKDRWNAAVAVVPTRTAA